VQIICKSARGAPVDDVYARYRESLKLGHQEAAEGRYAEALKHYESAAEVAADRALPHVAVAGVQLRLGHHREALAAYERALTLEPQNIDALTGRVAAYLAAGRRDDAARAQRQIEEALTAPARLPEPRGDATPMTRADTLRVAADEALKTGNVEAAIDAYLAESAEHATEKRFDAALDASLSALSVDSASPRVHLQMTRLYFERGWIDKAVERALLLDRLLSLDPDPAIASELQQLAVSHAADDERLAALTNRTG
jgi:protein O-GlcNAc transferase